MGNARRGTDFALFHMPTFGVLLFSSKLLRFDLFLWVSVSLSNVSGRSSASFSHYRFIADQVSILSIPLEAPRALESGGLQALLSIGDSPPEGGPSSRQQSASM